MHRNLRDGRLTFTTNLAEGIAEAEIIFIAVGTPQGDNGGADLSGVWEVGCQIAAHLRSPRTVVIKSTVPVGTNAELARRMAKVTSVSFDVASNPEFLKEGAAIDDFNKPDRIVVGARRPEAAKLLHALYEPFLRTDRPFLVMSPESAEMTKYVANCLLATKISFINEMANLCEAYGADINDVRRGIGHDQRIGFHFLFPGVGYGGSCFPKDIRAVIHMAQAKGVSARMMEAVDASTRLRRTSFSRRSTGTFGGEIKDKTIALWGLAFKPRTDDVREAPALVLIDLLLEVRRALAGSRSRGTAQCSCPLRRPDRLLRSPLRCTRAGRCPGRRHRVERVSQPGFRGDAPPDASTDRLRRSKRLRPGPHGRPRIHLSGHRAGSDDPGMTHEFFDDLLRAKLACMKVFGLGHPIV